MKTAASGSMYTMDEVDSLIYAPTSNENDDDDDDDDDDGGCSFSGHQ